MPVDPTTISPDLAALLADGERAGWRGWLLSMGRVRGVMLISVASLLASLAATALINWLLGTTDFLAPSLLVAALVPLIVAPLASSAALGLLNEVEAARAALREVAVRDGLTRLYSRSFFAARLHREIERARRECPPQPLCLLLVDIDYFKRINDTCGHAGGDRVLQQVASLLVSHCRPADVAARIGGEEFVLLLPGSSATAGVVVAERVRSAIEALRLPDPDDGRPLPITASLGVAALWPAADDADALLRRADAALYRAKAEGRNRSVVAEAPWITQDGSGARDAALRAHSEPRPVYAVR